MARSSNAETTKDSELMTKTASRPNAAASKPPRPDPSESETLHVTDDKALATRDSSGVAVMFGMTALRPGSKKAQNTVSRKSRTYSSQAVSRDCANNMQNVTTARA